MKFIAVLGLLTAAAAPTSPAPSAPPAPPPGPPPIMAAIASGALHDPVRRLLLKPYADATATPLGEAHWDGTAAGLKSAGADLVLLGGPALATACAAQLVEKIDWDRLVRERFVGFAATDCGLPIGIVATALAWDRDRIGDTPGWSDFWDVAKHPGRRGLPRSARGSLEIALLADGVAPGDIYRTLRSADGVERAFRKLDQLKPYVEWWDKPGLPAQYLATGRVLMTAAPAAEVLAANAGPARPPRHFAVNWVGSLAEALSLAVPHGAPHPDAAATGLVIASDVARQAEFAAATQLGPANLDAVDLLPGATKRQSPSLPANLQAGLAIDESFWAENGAKLEARFAAWLGK